jgi:branched-chain amino acid transport system permease protein
LLQAVWGQDAASSAGGAAASILIYVLMAAVLYFKPRGLLPAQG